MPYIIDAVRAYATVGEICEALREVYGTYTEGQRYLSSDLRSRAYLLMGSTTTAVP